MAKQLEEEETENQLYDIKTKLWNQIVAEAEVTEVITEEVDAKVEMFNTRYKQLAEQQGLEWEEFLDQYFKYDEAEYEDENRDVRHESHRIYGTNLSHKHLPEMQKICGLAKKLVFSPILGDFYAGMATTILLPGINTKTAWEIVT